MSILKKTNAPYLVSGALAIATLLASGVFAVAPYVGFLAPVAALSLGLPFVIVGAVFSAVVIALSAVVINKSNTISEQKAQLANQTKEIEGKNKENFEQKARLANQTKEIEGKDKTIFEEEAKVKDQEQRNAELEAQLNERDEKIEKDALKVAIADYVIWSAKGAANGAIWSAKGVINSAWYVGKCTYNNLPPKERLSSSLQSAKDIQRASQEAFVTVKEAYSSGRLRGIFKRDLTDAYNACSTYVISTLISYEDQDVSYDAESGEEKSTENPSPKSQPTKEENVQGWVAWGIEKICNRDSLKIVGYIAGTGLLGVVTYFRGFSTADNLHAVAPVGKDVGDHISSSNLSPICLSPTYQQVMQNRIYEAAEKLANAEEFAKNNFGIPDNASHKSKSKSVMSKIPSILYNVWDGVSNLFGGASKSANNSEHRDLRKSEDLEEVIDAGVLNNSFSPRVDNGINTSKRQGTIVDSVELKRLNKELPPSAFPNGSPRVI